jgi:hypothetical protein
MVVWYLHTANVHNNSIRARETRGATTTTRKCEQYNKTNVFLKSNTTRTCSPQQWLVPSSERDANPRGSWVTLLLVAVAHR